MEIVDHVNSQKCFEQTNLESNYAINAEILSVQ